MQSLKSETNNGNAKVMQQRVIMCQGQCCGRLKVYETSLRSESCSGEFTDSNTKAVCPMYHFYDQVEGPNVSPGGIA